MKKGSVIFSLLVISILLISSVGFVSASWFSDVFGKITGKTVENVTEEDVPDGEEEKEVKPECPSISGWRVENNECTEDSGCDYDDSKYKYYSKEECESQLEPFVMECYDSDGGKNYYKTGSQSICDSYGGCNYPVPCDYCLDDKTLNECYCEGPEIRSEKYVCPEGCEDGACISKECPTIMGWRIENNYCVSDSGCDYDDSKYNYYNAEEECRKQLKETPVSSVCEEIDEVNERDDCYVRIAERTRDSSLCEKITEDSRKQKCYILAQREPPEPEIRPVPTICAVEIKLTFNKDVYYVGDDFKVIIEILDSNGNPIPYHHFYSQTYTYEPEGMWHSASLDKTDERGYFVFKGTIEEGQNSIGKTKHKIYIEAHDNCPYVETTALVEVKRKETETIQCAMGECVPIEEVEKEPIDIPTEKVFYSCTGCEVEDKCYPIGYRKEGEYCCIDNKFILQIEGECDNNFECKSNLCISGECMTEGFLEKVMEFLKKMIGIEPKPPVLKECSKLLIERNIGDNEYEKSGYGENEHTQVPVYSEDGENIGTIRCCMVDYSTGATIVCPFDSKEEVKNSLKWILARGDTGTYIFGEYKGEKVIDINDGEILAWTNNAYLIASGGKQGTEDKSFIEGIVDVYFKKYASDLDLTQDDIPYVPRPEPPKYLAFCTPEDEEKIDECEKSGGDAQIDKHSDKECGVYTYCITAEEKCEAANSYERDDCYMSVAKEAEDSSFCEKITDPHQKEKCYILVEE